MRIRSIGVFTTMAGLILSLAHFSSFAHAPDEEEPSLQNRMAASDISFKGAVVKLDYKLSTSGLPHTFVTYKINERLVGTAQQKAGSTVTLRFVGGPYGDGSYLTISDVPTFGIGDTDILMVKNNNSAECPLVDCMSGRIRLHNGGVYNAYGIPIQKMTKEGITASGAANSELQKVTYPHASFEALMQGKKGKAYLKSSGLSKAQLRKKFEENAPKTVTISLSDEARFSQLKHSVDRAFGTDPGRSEASAGQRQQSENAMSADNFFAELKRTSKNIHLRQSTNFKSSQSSKEFTEQTPEAVTPPKTQSQLAAAEVQMSDADRKEAEALKNNEYNPVLQ